MEKEIMFMIAEGVVFVVSMGFFAYKVKGKQVLTEAILAAEAIFNTPKMGEYKKEYVKAQIEKLPAPLRIFITEEAIEKAVTALQEKFKEIKQRKIKK
ncbi:hypothetical protein [Fusobacterium necrophorum]|uniref:hypothetical protein n=1 Tax=Fusobacterium necrophorum TaxID=859 RepID=UPI000788A5A3|nr:hypothetical protein [Fusobacterium necrophorum]KYM44115.1 hypothetical protein A2U15_07420 [Fusobacterium necrophorum subsp. funduliforme]